MYLISLFFSYIRSTAYFHYFAWVEHVIFCWVGTAATLIFSITFSISATGCQSHNNTFIKRIIIKYNAQTYIFCKAALQRFASLKSSIQINLNRIELFVFGSAFSYVFIKWNVCSIGLRSGDWLGHCRIFHFFYLLKLLGCFCCMFWAVVHLYYEAPPNQLCWIWLNLGRECIPIHFRILPLLLSSVTSSLNTITLFHWKPCMLMSSHCSTMFPRWCCMLWIISCFKPSPYFFLPVILVQVDLNFSRPKNALPEVVWLFKIFFGKV